MAQQGRTRTRAEASKARSGRGARPTRQVTELLPMVAVGLLVLVVVAFFWGHLTGSAFLWEDFTEFVYPNEVFAARSFAQGIIPYWNAYAFNGMPFMADLQIGYFYPPNQLMYLLSGGELSAWMLQFFLILHYVAAMIGTYLLTRYLGSGSWGATFAGVTYGLSGIIVAHMIHANMAQHLAWFPLIVYLFYRGVAERSWLHTLLAGLLLGATMLSGHPQTTLYIVFFLFCLTIFLVVRELRSDDASGTGERGRSLIAMLVAAAIPIAIGAGLFAIQLLPSQELAGLSKRATLSYEKTLEGAMEPSQLLTLVVPKVYGEGGANTSETMRYWYPGQQLYYYWETVVYFGVVALLLAVVGLASPRLGPLRWFLAGMGLLGLLYGLGDSFFIHPILSKLPLFGTFRSPVRLAMYLALGGAVLAGFGLERVIRADENETSLVKTVLITGGVIVAIALLAMAGILGVERPEVPAEIVSATRGTGVTAIMLAGIATLLAWASIKGKIPATMAGGGLLLLALIDLFIFGYAQNQSEQDPQKAYEESASQYAFFKADPPGKIFRVNMRIDGVGMLMPRNQGPFSGIMLYEGYNPLLLMRRVPPTESIEQAFDLLNVRYGLKADTVAGRAGLVERPTTFPHARMLYDVRVLDSAGVYNQMQSGGVDFARTVLLEKNPGIATDGTGAGTASITKYDASEIVVDVTTDKPGVLLLSEIWYPSWSVTVDDRPAELLIANHSLRGVPVPAGRHTVKMTFHSTAFQTGVWITLATLAVTVVGLIVLILRRRGRPAGEPVAA